MNKMREFIETERLWLRLPTQDDADFYMKLTNSPGWLQFIGDRHIHSLEKAWEMMSDTYIRNYTKYGFATYIITLKANRLQIGVCSIISRSELPGEDIGFALLPEYEKQGMAFEAAMAVKTEYFETFPERNLFAITTTNNANSDKLLIKLGFRPIKEIFVNTGGESADRFVLYGLNSLVD